jgi:hypothetical protein
MDPASVYQVFFTGNSEYHLQSHVCVGVRDRRTGQWFVEHPALSRPLAGAIFLAGQFSSLRLPHLGEPLEFDQDGEPLRTSPVLNIEERDIDAPATGVWRTKQRPVAQSKNQEDPRVTR